MLYELAAANAAFAVIKQAVSNGKEIAVAGNVIFVGAKEKPSRRRRRRVAVRILKSSWLREDREQEEQLKQIMIYATPWIVGTAEIPSEARWQGERQRLLRKGKRKKIVEGTLIGLFIVLCLSILGSIAVLILHHQGRL